MSESQQTNCPLDKEQVTKAVKALKSYISKTKKEGDSTLLDEHSAIQLQVTLHKIPAWKQKRILIDVPHKLFPKGAEICLITDDTDKEDAEKTEEHYKNVLKENGITAITKILPIKLVKSDYRSYGSRRELVDMYDLFLCDRTILFRMPSLLGKIFFSKRKDPWGVNMSAPDLKKAINTTLGCTRWFFSGNGSCSNMTVAKTTFPVSHIVENTMACSVDVAKLAPRGWNNVLSLNIKTDNSIALPVYYNDSPIDIDDLDLRELNYLLERKKRFDDKRRMWNLLGLKRHNRVRGEKMYFAKKNKLEDEKAKAEKEAAANETIAE